jgi:3-oxoacyl-[acyl-carrier-protein] synthase II
VVVTGIGLVSPLGIGLDAAWAAAAAGRSAAAPITLFDAEESGLGTHFACEVPGFEPTDHIDRRQARRMDRHAQLAVAAARLAVDHAALRIEDEPDRIGALVASGIGGVQTFYEQSVVLRERGADRVSPLFVPMMIANMAAAQVSMTLGVKGPLSCTVTACASANHALGDAADMIRLGRAEVMLAGGSEAAVCPIGLAGFNSMKALSTRNDDPAAASRPFDVGRDGFVMGEAGAVLVLEELQHALARGAEPLVELAGYGLSGDAHHLTEPDPTGEGPARAMVMAIEDAGLTPEDVDYVNAHGTSTPVGDVAEVRVLQRALGADKAARTMVSSTKSMHGHCLGAAGGIEAALTAMAVREGLVPPTINLDRVDPECAGVDHVAGTARRAEVRVALSNGFGFGGHNATVAITRYEDGR